MYCAPNDRKHYGTLSFGNAYGYCSRHCAFVATYTCLAYGILFSICQQAKKEEASARSPADLKFEEMQQYANNLDVQVMLPQPTTVLLIVGG